MAVELGRDSCHALPVTALLEARRLGVRAGPRTLFEGLDLEVSRGETLAIVGPSGSGKTSLLRTLALLTEPVAGEILLDGKHPDEIGITTFRRRVAYVAQRPVVLDGTVLDNLKFAFGVRAATTEFNLAAARDTLEQLGLPAAVLSQDARTLSQGQRQRVALARTLLTHASVLLLDEPTSSLDPDAVRDVEEQLRLLPCSIVLVTHDEQQIERLATRSLNLSQVIANG